MAPRNGLVAAGMQGPQGGLKMESCGGVLHACTHLVPKPTAPISCTRKRTRTARPWQTHTHVLHISVHAWMQTQLRAQTEPCGHTHPVHSPMQMQPRAHTHRALHTQPRTRANTHPCTSIPLSTQPHAHIHAPRTALHACSSAHTHACTDPSSPYVHAHGALHTHPHALT